jgi:hypothetical protein
MKACELGKFCLLNQDTEIKDGVEERGLAHANRRECRTIKNAPRREETGRALVEDQEVIADLTNELLKQRP